MSTGVHSCHFLSFPVTFKSAARRKLEKHMIYWRMRVSGVFARRGRVPTSRRDIAGFSRPVGIACATGEERSQMTNRFGLHCTKRDFSGPGLGVRPPFSSETCKHFRNQSHSVQHLPPPVKTPPFVHRFVTIFPAGLDSFAFPWRGCYNSATQPANIAQCAFVPSDVRQDA
jgi:hypothetical protein